MSRETAAQLIGKPLTQILRDDALLRLANDGAVGAGGEHYALWLSFTREQQLDLALDQLGVIRVTSASYSSRKGGRYQLALTSPEGGFTMMFAAHAIDPTGLHS